MSTQVHSETDSPGVSAPKPAGRAGDFWQWIVGSQAIVLLIFLIVLSIGVSVIAPRFAKIANMAVIARSTAFVSLVCLGQMTVMIGGLIDVSVASTAGFAGVVAALIMHNTNINPYLALLAGIAAGGLIGVLNGFLVTRLRLVPFMATLATNFAFNGAILVSTGGWAIPDIPDSIQWLGRGNIGPVPIPALITLGIALILAFVLNRTYVGRHIFAMGGNVDAATLVGVRVDRLRILCYVISGLLSALAGVMMMARLASGQPTIGISWMMPSFGAPILGGTAMNGGVGSVLGTLVGATIMTVISNAMVMTGMSVYWENVIVGAVLIGAITLDSVRTRSRGR
jgi:ribose transport system permease protein